MQAAKLSCVGADSGTFLLLVWFGSHAPAYASDFMPLQQFRAAHCLICFTIQLKQLWHTSMLRVTEKREHVPALASNWVLECPGLEATLYALAQLRKATSLKRPAENMVDWIWNLPEAL